MNINYDNMVFVYTKKQGSGNELFVLFLYTQNTYKYEEEEEEEGGGDH